MTLPSRTAPDFVQELELRTILGVLRRQYKVMLYTAFILMTAAGLYLTLTTPKYTANALIIVDPSAKNILDSTVTGAPAGNTESAKVDSEVEILRSDAIALAVIDRLGVAQDDEFRAAAGTYDRLARFAGMANASVVQPPMLKTRTLGKFRKAVTVRRRGLTYLISVSVTSQDPERAAELTNAMAEIYIERQVDAQIGASLAGRDILLAQMAAARANLAATESRFDRFIEANLPSVSDDAATANLLADLQANQAMIAEKQALQSKIVAYQTRDDWSALADVLQDPPMAALIQDRAKVIEQSFQLADLDAELSRIDALLSERAQQSLGDIRAEITQFDRRAAGLRSELRQAMPINRLSPDQLAELYAIQQEAGTARDQYQILVSRMQDMETQAALQLAKSRIVSPALAPVDASFPNKTIVLLMALAASAGLGVSMAFLNEYIIGGVTSGTQLSEVLHISTAAIIPFSKESNSSRLSAADRVIDAPLSVYSESLRKLRAAVDQELRQRQIGKPNPQARGKIIMISSALAGEGKTTTALALARTYAVAGRKTLLIDGDLRAPSVHEHLGFQPESGFLEYLRDPKTSGGLSAFYARDPSSSLAMILGSGRSISATDPLLSSATFESIIEQARQVYDVTIIDTPPVLPVVDARYVAHHADAAIFIAKWSSTTQRDLRAAVEPLVKALVPNAPLLPVLNQARTRDVSSGYGGYYGPYSAAI